MNCEPEIVFRHFETVCSIPHGSGNEKALSDFVMEMAKAKGLYAVQDKLHNVIVKIPASKGYEDADAVIIQGHLDMVCEQNKSTNHDFATQPLDVFIDGDWIKARGTTLGADNGIAVAYCMAMIELADDVGFKHPALELVLTTQEETGLDGAAFISAEELNAKKMINVDTDIEGFILTGCAGGLKATIHLPVEYEQIPQGCVAYKLDVKGLLGGHSGLEIDKKRANANRLLARILNEIYDGVMVRLCAVSGGLKDNAIPREAEAIFMMNKNYVEICIDRINTFGIQLKSEFIKCDPDIEIIAKPITNTPQAAFSDSAAKKVINTLLVLPNGPLAMSAEFEGIVETSNNVGVVRTEENEVVIQCAVRSSVDSRMQFAAKQIFALADLIGASVVKTAEYPAWEFQPESHLREILAQAYMGMYGKEAQQGVVHAGIECGLFAQKIAGLDMVSIGPDMFGIHTPDEKLSISSTRRTWEYLLKVLERLK